MTENSSDASDNDDSGSDINVSRLREMAIRGREYRETIEIEDYYGLSGDLYVGPLPDPEFLPIAAVLEERLDMDPEEAQEELEEDRESGDDDSIDPSNFDAEFVGIMIEAAIKGIDRTQGIAEGEDREGLREIFGVDEDMMPDEHALGLQGGLSLVIAERVLSMTSDAGSAESFRSRGSSE